MLSTLTLALALVSQCPSGSCAARGYASPSYGAYLPRPTYAAQPQAATLYYLADATGKTWSSPDARWLSTYVSQVNASVAQPRYTYPAYAPFTRGCVGGQCGR